MTGTDGPAPTGRPLPPTPADRTNQVERSTPDRQRERERRRRRPREAPRKDPESEQIDEDHVDIRV